MDTITTKADVSHALDRATAKTLCGKRVPGKTTRSNTRQRITCGSCRRALRTKAGV